MSDVSSNLSTRVGILEHEVSKVVNSLGMIGGEVSDIKNLLSSELAKPSFSIKHTLEVVRDLAILIGLSVSAVVYVAGSSFNSDIAILKLQQQYSQQTLKRLTKVE